MGSLNARLTSFARVRWILECHRAFFVLLTLILVTASQLNAQRSGGPSVDITLAAGNGTPAVTARGVLGEKAFDDLLRHGFPARLHFRAEQWVIGRWFDDIVATQEWDVIVRYDLIDRLYEVFRVREDGAAPLGTYSTFSEARGASELPFTPPFRADVRGQKGYFSVQVDVQTIEMSDLDEVQRWLRGEARPAVQGRQNPGTAVGRGFRTLVSRLLGGEVRRLEARTPTLRFDGRD